MRPDLSSSNIPPTLNIHTYICIYMSLRSVCPIPNSPVSHFIQIESSLIQAPLPGSQVHFFLSLASPTESLTAHITPLLVAQVCELHSAHFLSHQPLHLVTKFWITLISQISFLFINSAIISALHIPFSLLTTPFHLLLPLNAILVQAHIAFPQSAFYQTIPYIAAKLVFFIIFIFYESNPRWMTL